MTTLEMAFHIVYLVALIGIGVGLMFALIRAIRGPRTADRILGVNMAGTTTTLALALLAYVLDMETLVDVCLIYCLASFLAVVILTRLYVTVHRRKLQDKAQEQKEGGPNA